MKEKKNFTIVIIITLVVFVLVAITLIFGVRSLGDILLWFIGSLFVLSIFGLIVYAVYWLFIKKHKFDATAVNKANLIKSAKISKPEILRDLYLSGDRQHSRVRVGRIIGYCRIQTTKKIIDYDTTGQPIMIPHPNNPNKKIERFTLTTEEQDVFVVQKSGFPLNMIEEPMVVRVKPTDHDELVGDVTLNGFSIIPVSEYFYLNNQYLDVRSIDHSILLEANRSVFHEHLKDYKALLDTAAGLDSKHKKDIESKSLYEIPNMPMNRNE